MPLMRDSASMPTIKCSECGNQVAILEMADHRCRSNGRPLSPLSSLGSGSPRTPEYRGGSGRNNDYSNPRIADDYDSRRRGGYDDEDDDSYRRDFTLKRAETLTSARYDPKPKSYGRSDRSPDRGRQQGYGSSGNRDNLRMPSMPQKEGYGGFGPPRKNNRDDDNDSNSYSRSAKPTLSRSNTVPPSPTSSSFGRRGANDSDRGRRMDNGQPRRAYTNADDYGIGDPYSSRDAPPSSNSRRQKPDTSGLNRVMDDLDKMSSSKLVESSRFEPRDTNGRGADRQNGYDGGGGGGGGMSRSTRSDRYGGGNDRDRDRDEDYPGNRSRSNSGGKSSGGYGGGMDQRDDDSNYSRRRGGSNDMGRGYEDRGRNRDRDRGRDRGDDDEGRYRSTERYNNNNKTNQQASQLPRPTPPRQNRGRCRDCNKPIEGKCISSKDGLLSGKYHRECFGCFLCKKPFETSEVYVLEDRPYCEKHYHRLNGSMCGTCGTGISGEFLEDEAGTKHHVGCFSCKECRRPLTDGYFEFKGQAYCERDARKVVNRANGGSTYPASEPSSSSRGPGGSSRSRSQSRASDRPLRRADQDPLAGPGEFTLKSKRLTLWPADGEEGSRGAAPPRMPDMPSNSNRSGGGGGGGGNGRSPSRGRGDYRDEQRRREEQQPRRNDGRGDNRWPIQDNNDDDFVPKLQRSRTLGVEPMDGGRAGPGKQNFNFQGSASRRQNTAPASSMGGNNGLRRQNTSMGGRDEVDDNDYGGSRSNNGRGGGGMGPISRSNTMAPGMERGRSRDRLNGGGGGGGGGGYGGLGNGGRSNNLGGDDEDDMPPRSLQRANTLANVKATEAAENQGGGGGGGFGYWGAKLMQNMPAMPAFEVPSMPAAFVSKGLGRVGTTPF